MVDPFLEEEILVAHMGQGAGELLVHDPSDLVPGERCADPLAQRMGGLRQLGGIEGGPGGATSTNPASASAAPMAGRSSTAWVSRFTTRLSAR
jgi:hypothetical protein